MPNADDIRWFKQQFRADIETAIAGTPFGLDMLVAVACQETGYIWSSLRRQGLPLSRVVALCVGDTIDYKGAGKGRQAFPRNRAALEAEPRGEEMFAIARAALEDMSSYINGYASAVNNPDKFCHGYGVFQRDLQFFKDDPDYFLERRYETFSETLAHCLEELHRGLRKLGFENRTSITDFEFCCVAIAYNRGSYNPDKGLRQGHFDGEKYYGEWIDTYLRLARTVDGASAVTPGPYVVIAREGLKLRGGPGTNFASLRTLPTGSELVVVAVDTGDPGWAQVDIEGDGLRDGYVFGAFLAPASAISDPGEEAVEPD